MKDTNWMTDYEVAFRAANGFAAKVVICGGGWYRISPSKGQASPSRMRKAEVIEMTARLERRAAEQESK